MEKVDLQLTVFDNHIHLENLDTTKKIILFRPHTYSIDIFTKVTPGKKFRYLYDVTGSDMDIYDDGLVELFKMNNISSETYLYSNDIGIYVMALPKEKIIAN